MVRRTIELPVLKGGMRGMEEGREGGKRVCTACCDEGDSAVLLVASYSHQSYSQ
jgi:hypothetical protein